MSSTSTVDSKWRQDLTREQRLELLLRRVVNDTKGFYALPLPLRRRIGAELRTNTLNKESL